MSLNRVIRIVALLSGMFVILNFIAVSAFFSLGRETGDNLRSETLSLFSNIVENTSRENKKSLSDLKTYFSGSNLIQGTVWLLDEKGTVLDQMNSEPFPSSIPWQELLSRHSTKSISVLRHKGNAITIKTLQGQPARFLVYLDRGLSPETGKLFKLLTTIFIVLIGIILTLSIFVVTVYIVKEQKVRKLMLDVQRSDQARIQSLQEICHDLRTPLASIRSIAENLADYGSRISQEEQKKNLNLVVQETGYIEKLSQDLMTLALITSEKPLATKAINLSDMLSDLVNVIEAQPLVEVKKIILNIDPMLEKYTVKGNPDLLRRLFRNAIENSLRFARFKVSVSLYNIQSKLVCVEIVDDGPGLTETEMGEFGTRRTSRLNKSSNHLSLGLGSIIMKSIADKHHASLKISNIVDRDKKILGAKLEVCFSDV